MCFSKPPVCGNEFVKAAKGDSLLLVTHTHAGTFSKAVSSASKILLESDHSQSPHLHRGSSLLVKPASGSPILNVPFAL